MIKSKYESVSDRSLFKFLKYLYKDVGTPTDGNSYDYTAQNDTENSLKKFGLELESIDIDFFWALLILNEENLSKYDNLEFDLKRPECNDYRIECKFTGRQWYVEWGSQIISAYSSESAEGFTSSDDFQAWDSDFYDLEVTDSQTDDWNVESVEKVKTFKFESEKKVITKQLMKENFENIVSDYNIDELIQMRDIIDEKLKNRISFI